MLNLVQRGREFSIKHGDSKSIWYAGMDVRSLDVAVFRFKSSPFSQAANFQNFDVLIDINISPKIQVIQNVIAL